MEFTRDAPSPRYHALLAEYRRLHAEGERRLGLSADQTYPGVSLLPHVARIGTLIRSTGARTLLDYGSGKGIGYALAEVDVPGVGRVDGLLDFWDVDCVHCYDPCVPEYAHPPEDRFDGVIATDVLEHCPEEDLRWIAAELFSYARSFVFASIACYPAKTRLPSGENAHCTVRPAHWWRELFAETRVRYPGVLWQVHVTSFEGEPSAGRLLCETLGNV